MSRLDELDDNELVRLYLDEGDGLAAEVLLNRRLRDVSATCFNLCGGDIELARDLCQETYLRALQNLPRFRFKSSFRTWITRIAGNVCIDHHRCRWRRTLQTISENQIEEEVTAANPGPDEILNLQQEASRLRRALSRLPPKHYRAIVDRFFVGLPTRKSAVLEKVSEVMIRRRRKQALDMLASILNREEK